MTSSTPPSRSMKVRLLCITRFISVLTLLLSIMQLRKFFLTNYNPTNLEIVHNPMTHIIDQLMKSGRLWFANDVVIFGTIIVQFSSSLVSTSIAPNRLLGIFRALGKYSNLFNVWLYLMISEKYLNCRLALVRSSPPIRMNPLSSGYCTDPPI